MPKIKKGGGPAEFGKPGLTIDKPGFWPSLTDEEVELMAGRLRARLTDKQAARADKELEVRAARKKRKKPTTKGPSGTKHRKAKKPRGTHKSPKRFLGEGAYDKYGRVKQNDDPEEWRVRGSRPAVPKQKRKER